MEQRRKEAACRRVRHLQVNIVDVCLEGGGAVGDAIWAVRLCAVEEPCCRGGSIVIYLLVGTKPATRAF